MAGGRFDAAGQLKLAKRCLGGSDMDRLQAIMEKPDGFIVAAAPNQTMAMSVRIKAAATRSC